MKPLGVFLLVLCATGAALAGENEFRGVVRSIERTYGVHHMRIPLLGFAMWFAKPEGVSGMKLAVFEGFQASLEAEDLSRLVESSLGDGWHPFVRVRSHSDGETTLIYANPAGGKMRMLIVSLEPSEATVVEFSLNDRAIKSWLKEPGEEAEGHRRNFD